MSSTPQTDTRSKKGEVMDERSITISNLGGVFWVKPRCANRRGYEKFSRNHVYVYGDEDVMLCGRAKPGSSGSVHRRRTAEIRMEPSDGAWVPRGNLPRGTVLPDGYEVRGGGYFGWWSSTCAHCEAAMRRLGISPPDDLKHYQTPDPRKADRPAPRQRSAEGRAGGEL